MKEEETIQEITITELRPNPYQPRKHFNKEAIQELSASIKEHGILQPLIARKVLKDMKLLQVKEDIVLLKRRDSKKYLPL